MTAPVNTGSLTGWVDHIEQDVRDDMDTLAPMLRVLGYDPNAYPPNYGTRDSEMEENSSVLRGRNNNISMQEYKRKRKL